MKDKLIITRFQGGIATALYHDGRAVELSFDRETEAPMLGNIYIGRVQNVVKNIQAAFVEIEGGIPCYLPLSEKVQPYFTNKINSPRLVAGDELLVQIARESVKTKAPTLTANISLPGKYLVLTSGKTQTGVSAKIAKKERERLQGLAEEFPKGEFGWIIRTNAAEASEEEICLEAQALAGRFEEICRMARHRTCRSCLYRSPAAWLTHLKDIRQTECEEILTDDRELHSRLQAYLAENLPGDADKLSFYEDRLLPLYKLYSLEAAFEEALRERVWLRSGAYLVIQPTEALTAIDVNTGKCERGKKASDTFLKINMEAAREAARQIRLRNLSGIILIDFINMDSKEDEQRLLAALDAELQKDPVKAYAVDITPLGLAEVTRRRVQKPLAEKLRLNHHESQTYDACAE